MKICDDDHDEIVYDDFTGPCPLCKTLRELDDSNSALDKAETELLSLQTQLDECNSARNKIQSQG